MESMNNKNNSTTNNPSTADEKKDISISAQRQRRKSNTIINQEDKYSINNLNPEISSTKGNANNPYKKYGVICFIIAVAGVIYSVKNSVAVNSTPQAQSALQNGFSKDLAAGTVLLQEDAQRESRDYTVHLKQQANKQTTLLVWDYAAEDGDYVQLFYNGIVISEPFMIKHQPKVFTISPDMAVSSSLQVKGIKDGGGGITYAVMFTTDVSRVTYYNAAPVGKVNTYTLLVSH